MLRMKKFSLVVALFAHRTPVNVVFVSELGSVTGAHRDSSITLLMKLFDQRQMPVAGKAQRRRQLRFERHVEFIRARVIDVVADAIHDPRDDDFGRAESAVRKNLVVGDVLQPGVACV